MNQVAEYLAAIEVNYTASQGYTDVLIIHPVGKRYMHVATFCRVLHLILQMFVSVIIPLLMKESTGELQWLIFVLEYLSHHVLLTTKYVYII